MDIINKAKRKLLRAALRWREKKNARLARFGRPEELEMLPEPNVRELFTEKLLWDLARGVYSRVKRDRRLLRRWHAKPVTRFFYAVLMARRVLRLVIDWLAEVLMRIAWRAAFPNIFREV